MSSILRGVVILCSSVMLPLLLTAQSGYRISGNIEGFTDTTVYLANYFMDKQYIVDTARATDGKFEFADDEALPQGSYLLVLPPKNDFAQVQIGEDQEFSVSTQVDDLIGNMKIRGSDENTMFYSYMQLIGQMAPVADSLRKIQSDSTLPAATRAVAKTEGERIDAIVKAKQTEIKTDYPKSVTAAILRSMDEVPMPEFEGSEEELQRQRYQFYKQHYFDNVDLGDSRALRSSYLDQRVTYYMEKLVVPNPDSINKEIDYVLEQMRPSEETFRFYVSKFLNQYAASKIVGQDAVYAHVAEKYYVGGQTPWTDAETLRKITDNVDRIKPLLIGKKAPPMVLKDSKNEDIDIYALDADFTVLFFFDPECGHCKKQTPFVIDFAKKYKAQGVSTVSICSKFFPDREDCWKYVKDKPGMAENMYNGYDPYHKSKYKVLYDIFSSPQIFVLDREKRIISKKISAEQLDEVVGRFVDELREG